MKNNKFYTCKYDRVFKEIMLNEDNSDILKWLLESILEVKITDLKIRNLERNSGNVHIKKKILDALLETNIGKIEIEVNSTNEEYRYSRNMGYIADVYSHDILVGEDYTEDKQYIQINLSYELKDNKKIRIYKMMDEEGKEFVSNFKIYEINMDYYKKIWHNKNEKEIEKNKSLIMLDLGLEDLKELSKKDKMVKKYMENINKVNKDPEFREYISYEEDQRKIYNTRMKNIREGESRLKERESRLKEDQDRLKEDHDRLKEEEARVKKLEKEVKEKIKESQNEENKIKNEEKINIAKNMIKDNIDTDTIVKYTGLSIDEINSLK